LNSREACACTRTAEELETASSWRTGSAACGVEECLSLLRRFWTPAFIFVISTIFNLTVSQMTCLHIILIEKPNLHDLIQILNEIRLKRTSSATIAHSLSSYLSI